MRPADSSSACRVGSALMLCLIAIPQTVGIARQSNSASVFDGPRLMSDIQAYYGFGVHRTSYPGDLRTLEWLAGRFRSLGLQTSMQRWPLRQFFLEDASIEDAQGRIHAFPLWLPRATGHDGLRGRLALVDASTPSTGLAGTIAWLQPGETGRPTRQELERRALEAGATGIVFTTSDTAGTGLLVAQNAERRYVDVERPVPTLTFGA